MTTSGGPAPVRLTSERFLVRSCTPEDASERWIAWAADPDVMRPLNAPLKAFTHEELARYIAGFDNFNRYLLGIFERECELQIGFHILDLHRGHRRMTVNVIIGDKDWWGRKVVLETRAAVLDHFFLSGDVEKAVGTPIARNFPAVFNYKAQGWTLEGTFRGHVRSAEDGARLDQYQFAMLRGDWLDLRRPG